MKENKSNFEKNKAGYTARATDRPTDMARCRVACPRLKKEKETDRYRSTSNFLTPLFWQQKNFDIEEIDTLINFTFSLLLKATQSQLKTQRVSHSDVT